MEKVERKRKTDRDLYDADVVEVDTTRKELRIHLVGLSHEYDEWRDNYLLSLRSLGENAFPQGSFAGG